MTTSELFMPVNALVPGVYVDGLPTRLASILQDFLQGMEYEPLIGKTSNDQLEAAMLSEMKARNMCCSELERLTHTAANYVEFSYPYHTFDEKTNIALYNWYMMYLDDLAPNDVTSITAFQERFFRRQPQLNPVFEALNDVFIRIYEMNEPLTSNLVITCTQEFLTSTAIEPQTRGLHLVRSAWRFPWFMRERTGFGEAYAHLLFTKRLGVSLMDYIEALPDMTFWMDLTNDLLSFYKEEIAGERDNYVHLRASVERKDLDQVLSEMKDELISSQKIIQTTLAKCPTALRIWKGFERGFIFWHLSQDRYKLQDLGL